MIRNDLEAKGQEWQNTENIVRKKKQGRQALEGDPASKFLHNVGNLELALNGEGGEIPIRGVPYVETLRSYLKVQDACMGLTLKDNWKETIERFTNLYLALEISVTPKVHMVMHHLTDFFELKGEEHGLSYWTEQAFEAVHHDFKVIWERYKVSPDHPEYGARLLRAVSAYNASHL